VRHTDSALAVAHCPFLEWWLRRLGRSVGDRLLMLDYSTYALISPEGCAAILWKNSERKELAAEALNLTAPRLADLGFVDEVLPEPLGGAHRDPAEIADTLRGALVRHLAELSSLDTKVLVEQRQSRIASYGVYNTQSP
jgi:acetyl-CoA carboxylase carboxyl transferase subunit alpha